MRENQKNDDEGKKIKKIKNKKVFFYFLFFNT